MRFEFTVIDDYPPKKDGSNSMWGKKPEFDRLRKLRLEALKAL